MASHGGKRPGSGHKRGVPNPNAGRRVSTLKLKSGQVARSERFDESGKQTGLSQDLTIRVLTKHQFQIIREDGRAEQITIC